MRPATVIALAALVWANAGSLQDPSWQGLRSSLKRLIDPGGPAPDASPVVDRPGESLARLVQPIREKLAGDAEKAARVAAAARGFADAIDGPAGKRLQTTGQFNQVVQMASPWMRMADGVSVGDEVRAVFREHVGFKPDPESPGNDLDETLDDPMRQRIVEAYEAILWAALTTSES